MKKPFPEVYSASGRKHTLRDHRKSLADPEAEVVSVKDFSEIKILFESQSYPTVKEEKMVSVTVKEETPVAEAAGENPFVSLLGDMRVATLSAMDGQEHGVEFSTPMNGAKSLDEHRDNQIAKLKEYVGEKPAMKLSTKIIIGLGVGALGVLGLKRFMR